MTIKDFHVMAFNAYMDSLNLSHNAAKVQNVPQSTLGTAYAGTIISNGYVYILMSQDLDDIQYVDILAHEAIHVWQIYNGLLQFDGNDWYWKGTNVEELDNEPEHEVQAVYWSSKGLAMGYDYNEMCQLMCTPIPHYGIKEAVR